MTDATWLVGRRTALLVALPVDAVPVVRAWGPAPDDPSPDAARVAVAATTPAWTAAGVDMRVDCDLLPREATGFMGTPALSGSFLDGMGWALRASTVTTRVDGATLRTRGLDPEAALQVDVELAIDPHDVVTMRAAVTNLRDRDPGPGAVGLPPASAGVGRDRRDVTPDHFRLDALRLTLPVPDRATEVLDFQGRWIREMHPQRHAWQVGVLERVNRRGRTSHEDPPLLLAGDPGFSHERGAVWAIHLGWSGNHALRAERTGDGFAFLQAGEHLHPGEVTLGPGQTYASPVLYAAASDRGTNGISDAFHAHVRARPGHPATTRPVTLNTWEAVYFDHDRARLDDLVGVAADLGIERFVLDDGWFTARDDDTAGLGDWVVDPAKHPGGLADLADHVRAAGLEFGLWVEPEMVNPDSDLARADPSVTLARDDTPEARHQHVLDLARPDLFAHVRDRLDAAIADARPGYLKWDCNRDHVGAEHDGVAATHAHVLATYRLLDDLRAAHPGLEIESCASGGARIDLAILERTDRVWASDTNDPVERQRIQQWLSVLLPPELVGSHVGPTVAHTTGRATSLAFRLATAFFDHFGFEWDLTTTTAEERDRIRAAVALHRRWRPVLHGGRVVRVDHPDPAAVVHAVVGSDAAMVCHAQLATSAWARPAAVRVPGLDPGRTWRVEPVACLTDPPGPSELGPAWLDDGFADVRGDHLADHGIALPVHQPATATVLAIRAVGADTPSVRA